MTVIDPSTDLGKLRLRCADFSDLVYLPDAVYLQTLADNNNSLPISAKICATYILGMLSFKTHRKIGLQLENWSGEAFTQYKEYLLLIVSNPNFMDISPIPYNVNGTTLHPLIKFQEDWNSNYAQITQSQQLAMDAIGSPSSSALWYWPQ
jgi:hypothetical protein